MLGVGQDKIIILVNRKSLGYLYSDHRFFSIFLLRLVAEPPISIHIGLFRCNQITLVWGTLRCIYDTWAVTAHRVYDTVRTKSGKKRTMYTVQNPDAAGI